MNARKHTYQNHTNGRNNNIKYFVQHIPIFRNLYNGFMPTDRPKLTYQYSQVNNSKHPLGIR